MGTPLAPQQGQLTWMIGSYQGLTTNEKAYRSCIMPYGMHVENVHLSFHLDLPTCGVVAIPIAVDCLWKLFTDWPQ